MQKIKTQKGITLVALIITIIVILIITTTVIIGVNEYSNNSALISMQADIEVIKNKAIIYYNDYGEIPVCEEINSTVFGDITVYTIDDISVDGGFLSVKDNDDGDVYYQIDTSKLNNLTLNFGTEDDIYVINSRTLNVYYVNGIESNGTIQYTY